MSDTEYDVPDGDEPAECGYCGRPFAREEWLALHRGLQHPNQLDDAEATAFQDAYDEEETAIGNFRLRALGALIALYFCLLMIYALV
jgi:hypothetical protein